LSRDKTLAGNNTDIKKVSQALHAQGTQREEFTTFYFHNARQFGGAQTWDGASLASRLYTSRRERENKSNLKSSIIGLIGGERGKMKFPLSIPNGERQTYFIRGAHRFTPAFILFFVDGFGEVIRTLSLIFIYIPHNKISLALFSLRDAEGLGISRFPERVVVVKRPRSKPAEPLRFRLCLSPLFIAIC
jgi:hypothetical protein